MTKNYKQEVEEFEQGIKDALAVVATGLTKAIEFAKESEESRGVGLVNPEGKATGTFELNAAMYNRIVAGERFELVHEVLYDDWEQLRLKPITEG